MQVTEAISRIRASAHDITDEYDDMECVFALNTAAYQIASLLISEHYAGLLAEKDFEEGEALPDNFFKPAGLYPIRMTGRTIHLLCVGPLHVRYYAMPDEIVRGGMMPFRLNLLNNLTVKVALKMLLNEDEFDISQDSGIQNEIMQAIQTGTTG